MNAPNLSAVLVDDSLQALAARINHEHGLADEGYRTSLTHAIHCGHLLKQAKLQVEHGRWLSWLKDNVCFTPRTAQLYMRLANAKSVAHLGGIAEADAALRDMETRRRIVLARIDKRIDPTRLSLCEKECPGGPFRRVPNIKFAPPDYAPDVPMEAARRRFRSLPIPQLLQEFADLGVTPDQFAAWWEAHDDG